MYKFANFLFMLGGMGILTLLSSVLLRQQELNRDQTQAVAFENDHLLKPRTRAVIHMGIPKTGTTSIQEDSKAFKDELLKDGYEMLWDKSLRSETTLLLANQTLGNKWPNLMSFAACFLSPSSTQRKQFPCDPDLLLKGNEVAQRGMNLYVSSEFFCNIDAHGVHDLASYLKQWDEVEIVVYYRRFYSWFASFYNQWIKARKWSDNSSFDWETPINDYLHTMILKDDWPAAVSGLSLVDSDYHRRYAVPLLERLRPHFSNIIVMDYHDKEHGGSSESFYCTAMPQAHHTCQAVRSSPSKTITNKGRDLAYSDIVYAAWKKGMVEVHSDARFEEIVNATQDYAEEQLKIGPGGLPKVCPSADDLKQLWDLSLRYDRIAHEKYLSNASLFDEENLRSDFREASETYLCATDVEKILAESRWQSFFASFHADVRHPLSGLHFCTSPFPFEDNLNNTEFELYYQCEGDKYDDFTKRLWDYALHNLTTGRQIEAFPANSTVLAIGNSHTRQTINALVCQYGGTVTHVNQVYNSPGTLREVNFDNGATLVYATNTPLFYSDDWDRDVLQGIFNRTLKDFDALILGNFNPLPSEEDLKMYEFARLIDNYTQAHSELNFDPTHKPTFEGLASKFRGPILYVSMFAEFAVDEMTEIADQVIGKSDRKDLVFVDGRKHIEALQIECGTDGHYEIGVCLHRGDEHSYGQLVENMHRCNGPGGGHADLVAWDIVEAIHRYHEAVYRGSD